jgi:hypothetical protein
MAGGGQAKLARDEVGASEREHRPAETSVDAQEIRELLEFFAREGLTGKVTNGTTVRVARITAVDSSKGVMRLELSGDLKGPGLITLELSHLHLNCALSLNHDGRSLSVVRIPERMTKTVRRASRRAPAALGLVIALEGADPESSLLTHVIDLSRTGLSFEIAAEEAAPYVRDLALACSLHTTNGETAQLTATVRSFRQRETKAIVGLEIHPISPDDARILEEELERALYPDTRCRQLDLWDVYTTSGYLELSGKHPEDFEALRRAHDETARKLEPARDVASVACSPREGVPLATASNLKLYQSTWLLCHVSKRKLPNHEVARRDTMREVYLRIYEAAQADNDTRWLLTYIQDLAPTWSKRLHIEIPRRYIASGDGCLVPFRALETEVDPLHFSDLAGTQHLLNSRLRVVEDNPELGRLAARDLCRVRPAQYLDALDLSGDRLSLAVPSARWARAGLRRERSVLVALDGTTRCAMAVVERAERGAHLYGLLDCVRMYPLRLGGERAFASLLLEAHRWYQRRGLDRFVWLDESNGALPALQLGFRDLGGATLTLLSIDRLPELMQRVAELSSQRPPASSHARGSAAHS